ncbi:MAG: DUF2905 domain-containing protein [Chloroflexi bacterium]|jgi:hypothetical protein|nr:DUF2905 domain-containing protein [Chloroflexota bacterium]
MDLNSLGRLVLLIGIGLLVLGGVLMLFSRLPFLKDLGSLPGDVRIEGKGYSCFFPIVSMIVLSLLLTLVLNIVIRLINR